MDKEKEAFCIAEANEVAPRGCLCGNNGGADCEWCLARKSASYEWDENNGQFGVGA